MHSSATRTLTVDEHARVDANRQTALHRQHHRQHRLTHKLTAVPDAGTEVRTSLTPEQLARVEENRQAALARKQHRHHAHLANQLEQHAHNRDAWTAEETLIRAAGFTHDTEHRSPLTPEQLARVEENRQAALAKKQHRARSGPSHEEM